MHPIIPIHPFFSSPLSILPIPPIYPIIFIHPHFHLSPFPFQLSPSRPFTPLLLVKT